MTEDENRFEPRLGRVRNRKGRKAVKRSLQALLIARIARGGGDVRRLAEPASARATGRFNSRGRGAKFLPRAGHGRGWSVDPVSKMRVRSRRVMVKARVVKLAGAKAISAAGAHLRYLQRDGVTREGEQGRFYSTFSDDADGNSFLARGEDDRHQFRFIVSPEDGAEFETLRSFTRELMAKVEQDRHQGLQWEVLARMLRHQLITMAGLPVADASQQAVAARHFEALIDEIADRLAGKEAPPAADEGIEKVRHFH